MVNKDEQPPQKRCGTHCQYLELPSFSCIYAIQNIHHRKADELRRKLPVIDPKSKHPRDSEGAAEERFYRSVLEEVLGEDKANTLLEKISEENQVNAFFQNLRDRPALLRKYVDRKIAKNIMKFIGSQDKSDIPIYMKLRDPCPYDKPSQTMHGYLTSLRNLGKRTIQAIKDHY